MNKTPQLYDENFPIHEQFPRQIDFIFLPSENNSCSLWVRPRIGGLIEVRSFVYNWGKGDDGYKWYHIFHLSLMANLGWSPIVRDLLGLKRRSNRLFEKGEDSPRPQIIEEGIISYFFLKAEQSDFYINKDEIPIELINFAMYRTRELEIKSASEIQWRKAISDGFSFWKILKTNDGGIISLDLIKKSLKYSNCN